MAFPRLAGQIETSRKILEDIQHKKQLLQKGINPVADLNLSSSINQVSTTQGQVTDLPQASGSVRVPRSAFNPTSATTTGYFISQDSHYGNSFIPVLPRFDPPSPDHTTK